jgi:hypothetical protein
VYVVNEVEIPIQANTRSVAHAARRDVPASLDLLPDDEKSSPPFQGWMTACDGYLARWVALRIAPATALPPLPAAAVHHRGIEEAGGGGAASSLVDTAAVNVQTMLRLEHSARASPLPGSHSPQRRGAAAAACADASAGSSSATGETTRRHELYRPAGDPYALRPSIFGPCLPYAITPLLYGQLWKDILVAGPVIKYSLRKDCWYKAYAALYVPGGRIAAAERARAVDAAMAARQASGRWGADSAEDASSVAFPCERAVLMMFKGRAPPAPHAPPRGLPAALPDSTDPPLWASYAASRSVSLTVRRSSAAACVHVVFLFLYPPLPRLPFTAHHSLMRAGWCRYGRRLGQGASSWVRAELRRVVR